MRKGVSILVLVCLLTNLAGFYVYYCVRVVEIKREMNRRLAQTSPELFQKIVLSTDEYLEAREGDDEVEWKNSMYDIAWIEFNEGSVVILALRDEMETDLISFISGILSLDGNAPDSFPVSFTQYLNISLRFVGPLEMVDLNSIGNISHNTHYLAQETGRFLQVVSPPPRQNSL